MFRALSFCSVLNLQFQAKMSAVSFHHECKCTVKEYFHENVKKMMMKFASLASL